MVVHGDIGHVGRSGHRLVVEDDPLALDLAIDVLTSAGYAARGASSVAEALDRVRGSLPDLLVLDLRLGAEDGLDVVRALREDPATRGIPVIASSASTCPGDLERARLAGCHSFLAKPLTPREFLEGVDVCLESTKAGP